MPSLLESFYFVFDADTKGVKKGLDEGKKASTELESKLQGLDKTAQKIGVAFIDLARQASAAVAGIVALGAIKKLVVDTANHTFEIRQQAAALAISTESLSAWQNAVRTSGGTAEGATSSLSSLQQKLIELSRFPGGMTSEGFMLHRLGLSAEDLHKGVTDPISAMGKLADTFHNLSAIQQQFVGKRLGFDQGTIALLAQGRRALDEHIGRMRELGTVTKEQANATAAFKFQSAELSIELETVAREVVGVLLPPLTWLLRKISDTVLFLREHKGFTIAFFTGLGLVVADVVVPAFASAAVAVWAFLAPILAGPVLIGALIAVLALLFDDAMHFMNGQNSLIGELAKKWPMLGMVIKAAIQGAIDIFELLAVTGRDAINYLVAIAQFLGNVITEGPTKALRDLNKATGEIFDDMRKHFSGAIDDAKKLGQGFSDVLHGKNPFKHDDDDKADQKADTAVSKGQSASGQQIAAKLVKMGWTPAQAAGIAGSLLQESGGDPNARNKTSGAQGLGQWLGSRKTDFEKYSGHSLDTATTDEQLAFMNYELTQGKEQRAGNMLKQAQTPEEAARIHAQYYERPGTAEANIARRQALADNIASGQQQMADASSNPVNTQNSNAISNSVRNRGDTTINVAPATIHTQATDGKALASGYSQHLNTQLRNAQDQDDDGIAA
jgi:hypothetical protein